VLTETLTCLETRKAGLHEQRQGGDGPTSQ